MRWRVASAACATVKEALAPPNKARLQGISTVAECERATHLRRPVQPPGLRRSGVCADRRRRGGRAQQSATAAAPAAKLRTQLLYLSRGNSDVSDTAPANGHAHRERTRPMM